MLPADALPTMLGFTGSGIFAGGLIVAQAAGDALPGVVKAWMDGGFSLALLVCLSYAVTTLWKRLQQRDEHIATLNEEHRKEQANQRTELLEALNKLMER
jgi:hypothetical protein